MDRRDIVLDCASRLCQLETWETPTARPKLKRLMATIWKSLSRNERKAFLAALDEENKLTKRKGLAAPSEELEVLSMIRGWSAVLANVQTSDRPFAMSIMKKRNDVNWWPSEKQIFKMKQVWKERSIEGGNVEVVE